MSEAFHLCHLAQLSDPGCLGVTLELPAGPVEIVLVRRENQVFGYRNRCPHTGVNLEWVPDQFLDITKSFIQCATHGALFRIEDGRCLRGPCAGDSLDPIPVVVEGGQVLFYPGAG